MSLNAIGRGLAAALFLAAPALAEDKLRATYVLSGAPAGDGIEQTIAILSDRLDRLGLKPKIEQNGALIMAEIDEPDDKNEVVLVLTGRGVFSAHAADEIVETCPDVAPAGKICIPTISPQAPFMVIDRTPGIYGKVIERAVGLTGSGNIPQLAINLIRPAADRFREFTAAQIGNRVAIVIDEMIITAPKIHNPIQNGAAVLAGPGIPVVAWSVMLSAPPLPHKLDVVRIEVKAPAE